MSMFFFLNFGLMFNMFEQPSPGFMWTTALNGKHTKEYARMVLKSSCRQMNVGCLGRK